MGFWFLQGLRVKGLGFGGFGVLGLGFRVKGLGLRVSGVWGFGYGVFGASGTWKKVGTSLGWNSLQLAPTPPYKPRFLMEGLSLLSDTVDDINPASP